MFANSLYFLPGGLLPRPGPDGFPVRLGPFSSVEVVMLFSKPGEKRMSGTKPRDKFPGAAQENGVGCYLVAGNCCVPGSCPWRA